jgi:hypothetical protein
VSLTLQSTIHPAVAHTGISPLLRVTEALSSVALQILGDRWAGCVLIGLPTIQRLPGGVFLVPPSWLFTTQPWHALPHEVAHEIAVTEIRENDPVFLEMISRTLAGYDIWTSSLKSKNQRWFLNMFREVFSDLIELFLVWEDDWPNYFEALWTLASREPKVFSELPQHLLRVLCVKAAFSSLSTGSFAQLISQLEGVQDAIARLSDSQIPPEQIKILKENALKYQAAFEHLFTKARNSSNSILASNERSKPLTHLKTLVRNRKHLSALAEAEIIWSMSEWFRLNRKVLTAAQIAELPSPFYEQAVHPAI